MARRSGAGGAALAILLLASTLAVLSRPAAALSDLDLITQNTTGIGDMLSYDYHAVTCPRLVPIVRKLVHAAVQADASITPGLLRIHFHDCFPNGCDASILLGGQSSERNTQANPANSNLNTNALNLIENIRRSVHSACGATVSCADITAVATAEAVFASGGPLYSVPLGQMDSLNPATTAEVGSLPRPSTASVTELLQAFCNKAPHMCSYADLVALSGAHTVGSATCPAFQDRTQSDDFGRQIQQSCASNPNWVQALDMFTPFRFDNGYFFAVYYGMGVLTSDMALRNDPNTLQFVRAYAGNQNAFFQQFARSMYSLSFVRKPNGNVGEIRQLSCFMSNNGQHRGNGVHVDTASTNVVDVTADEGSAATASA